MPEERKYKLKKLKISGNYYQSIMAEFKISTNIDRDANASINYIVTKNANEVYDRIIHNYGRGQSSFSIIGSYGTGKSTFLWAFEKHIKGSTIFSNPVNGEFKGIKQFEFVRIIGELTSFKERFCQIFEITEYSKSSNKIILSNFLKKYVELEKRKTALILLVDEFGKHLEYIAKYNPDEMYFIQELAEFCNDNKKKILCITTLHPNISVYSKGLSKAQRNEWDKVRGRLIDIAFDEPVEQLLFFAAQRLKENKLPLDKKKFFNNTIKSIKDSNLLGKAISSKSFELNDLFPLDPLAADILTKSLQRYGQNERSLFTFLESPELIKKINSLTFFSVSDCFDYLTENLSSEIQDGEKNPFKPQWNAAIISLEKAENIFEKDFINASKIIKTICLINIFSNSIGKLDVDFLTKYSLNIIDTSNAQVIIEKLIEKRIIKFSNHRNKLNFINGTDVDIEQELINAAKFIDTDYDLVSRLESYFEFAIIPAKRIQYTFGTPRFFSFRFTSEIDIQKPKGEIDGFINLIFTKKKIEKTIRDIAEQNLPNQIFVLFKEIDQIAETIFEIDKINYVIKKYSDDKIAIRILNEEKLFRTNKLKNIVEDAMFDSNSNVTWIWNNVIDKNNNSKRKINSYRELNKLLSDASEATFRNTPIYLNEMVNKEYLSSPILTARKALIRHLINNSNEKDLGFDETHFPPEKTIYLSLIKKTGIYRFENNQAYFTNPTDKTFLPIWNKSVEFLYKSQDSKLPIIEFYEEFKTDDLKLKQGFIDFWVAIFLVIKKEDYSLYYEDGEYIPHLTSEVMDLIYKQPAKYFIKGLTSKGVKSDYLNFYKELVEYNSSNIAGLQSSYITIYGNFLKFYRSLEDYSKKTKTISAKAIGVRDAIALAKDPESALFTNIPESLGYYGVGKYDIKTNDFLIDLQAAIREIRSSYDQLITTIETEIATLLNIKYQNFLVFKNDLINMFGSINKNLIANDQLRLFYTRVVSPLDIKKTYWESICDATINKKLDKITDDEFPILISRLKENFRTLLDLADIHQMNIPSDQEVYQISIIDKMGILTPKKIIVTPKQAKESKILEKNIESLLGGNSEINRIALLKILEKEIKKNE
jgi:hypothetical protein